MCGSARAQIYEWAYVDPSDPGQGVYQSSTLCPGGAGVSAVPGANLSSLNLTQAYLINSNLTSANLNSATLTNADLQGSNLSNAGLSYATLTNANLQGLNLTNAYLYDATLTNANLANATVTGADFGVRISPPSSFTVPPATRRGTCRASGWRAHMTGWNFANQNLSNAYFEAATLTNANLANATVAGGNSGIRISPPSSFTVPPATRRGTCRASGWKGTT